MATWCEELTHLKRPWRWERLRAGGEGDDSGWDGWIASLTQWTWVWMNSGSWWWTGRPGMLQFMGSQRVGHDSDWTELTVFIVMVNGILHLFLNKWHNLYWMVDPFSHWFLKVLVNLGRLIANYFFQFVFCHCWFYLSEGLTDLSAAH